MYRLGVSTDFSAAHCLKGYQGSCEELHGHNYRVEAILETASLDTVGLGLDFREMKRLLGVVVGQLDHRLLNELDLFRENNPSTERVARAVFEGLAALLEKSSVRLVETRVWETPDAWAAWRSEGEAGS